MLDCSLLRLIHMASGTMPLSVKDNWLLALLRSDVGNEFFPGKKIFFLVMHNSIEFCDFIWMGSVGGSEEWGAQWERLNVQPPHYRHLEKSNRLARVSVQCYDSMEIYQFRSIPQKGIVGVVTYRSRFVQSPCSMYYEIQLLVPVFTKTLSDVGAFSKQESIVRLIQLLKGVSKILQFYRKLFQLQKEMVVFDSNNQLIIWLNKDFAKNQPQPLRRQPLLTIENDLIVQSFQLIQEHTEGRLLPLNFYNYLRKNLRAPLKIDETIVQMESFQRKFQGLKAGRRFDQIPIKLSPRYL